MRQDLGNGLTEGMLYVAATAKRAENLLHFSIPKHVARFGICPSCGNCQCGRLNYTPLKTFVCLCGEGKTMSTPTIIRRRGVR